MNTRSTSTYLIQLPILTHPRPSIEEANYMKGLVSKSDHSPDNHTPLVNAISGRHVLEQWLHKIFVTLCAGADCLLGLS